MNTQPDILRIAGINYDSIVDGEGVRATIFFSGCRHCCPGCHNASLQDPSIGILVSEDLIKKIADEINKRPYLSGITLTGGDPLYDHLQTEKFLQDLKTAVGKEINVWLYTGSVWEDIWHRRILREVDVLVDGPFVHALADKRLAFRGSSNQRIIDVQQSLRQGSAVSYGRY